MKRILCYGDSNTWGTIPDGSCRHCDITKTYPYYLQHILAGGGGENCQIICEGLPSRTTDLDDVKYPKGNRNGSLYFPQCLISHDPIDYVILFLGTNDLKAKFNRSVEEVANAIQEKYIKFTRKDLSKELTVVPQFIIIAPTTIDENRAEDFEGATKKSLKFNDVLQKMAKKNSCLFVSNENMKCGDDGIHLTTESHKLLAEKLAKELNSYITVRKSKEKI